MASEVNRDRQRQLLARGAGLALGATLLAAAAIATVPTAPATAVTAAPAPTVAPAAFVSVQGAVAAKAPTAKRFTDVPKSHKFYADITWLASEGITKGNPDGSFAPKSAVSRQAMAAFMYRAAGSPKFTAPARAQFKDVPKSHRYYKEISWLASEGITKGNPDGTFAPNKPVSRQAMAAFLYRFAGKPKTAVPTKAVFTDVKKNAKYAKEIAWLSKSGITKGHPDGSFAPNSAVSRQAMAAFLHRFDTKFGK